jgi:hypothetical protein
MVTAWYLRTHFETHADPGVLRMFLDPARVGAFAVTREELRVRDASALFRLLVATTMFQRRQDQQILRVLQRVSRHDVEEMTVPGELLRLIDECRCQHVKRNDALIAICDLTKRDGKGVCSVHPRIPCHLKRHTVTLKRYGHFGKVPSSAALTLRERGVASLEELRQLVFREHRDEHERSLALERELSATWRVSQKISAMFLSLLTNPDLDPEAPWQTGLDWSYFVVVDSNVDLFLKSIGYRGGGSYDDRRHFLQSLAREIDLQIFRPNLHSYNPRLVQQAVYLFMSRTNRRAMTTDCAYVTGACERCPRDLTHRCSAKPSV